MANERELELVEKGTPCYIDYSNKNLLTVKELLDRGYEECSNLKICEDTKIACVLRVGIDVARKVVKGSDLKTELNTLAHQDWIENEFWYSKDREEFTKIKGRSNALRAIESYSRIVLLQDTSKSILTECGKCGGVKLEETVSDSVWFRNGPGPCAGTGETRGRTVEYCPNCEEKPLGGIVYQEDLDKEEAEFLKKLRRIN